jgi:putative FmdB family regulatory protein
MAIYSYDCDKHGRFEMTRPMAESEEPANCPECGELFPRVKFVDATYGHDYKGLWMKNHGGYSVADKKR